MKQPILVPVDFSAHSLAALAFAGEVATRLNAPLMILHVVHDPAEAPGYYIKKKKKEKRLRKMEDLAQEMMEEFVRKAADDYPEFTAIKHTEPVLVVGIPVTRILEAVKESKPLMVVMGSQGRTGMSRLLLGSKAEQVVRLCPAPVTVVKSQNNND